MYFMYEIVPVWVADYVVTASLIELYRLEWVFLTWSKRFDEESVQDKTRTVRID